MPLYDITHPIHFWVDSDDAENFDVLQKARRTLDPRRFAKDVRIIQDAIQQSVTVANKNNRLIFNKTAFMVGHHAVTPHVDVVHLWDSADMVWPNPKGDDVAEGLHKQFMGGLSRWQTSLRGELWVVYRQDDPEGRLSRRTGEVIKISSYWVDENFVLNLRPSKTKPASTEEMSSLLNKFKGERSETNNHSSTR